MRRALAAVAVASAIGLATSGVALGARASSVTPQQSLAKLSATQIVNSSLANARAQGSCTNVAQGVAAGFTFGSSTNSGATTAEQRVTFNKVSGAARLVQGVLYVNEGATLIRLQFGKFDPRYANSWISIPRSNPHFPSFSSGLLFSSMIAQVRPAGVLKMLKVRNLHGVPVISIGGSANSQLGFTHGSETLVVAATPPYLPVELLAAGRSQGVPTTLIVTFSHWGQRFVITAPRGALPISSTNLP